MIIVSKYHDYYDSGMSYGIDKTLRFIRKTEKIDKFLEIPEVIVELLKDLPDIYNYWNNKNQLTARPFIIVFCGQVYLGYHFYNLRGPKHKRVMMYYVDPDIYTYDLSSIEKILQKYDKDRYKTFHEKGSLHRLRASFRYEDLERAFKDFKNKKMDISIHLDEEAPVLYIGYDEKVHIYIKNPVLRKLQFYKIMNAFEVFQDISMFIGGVCSKTFPPTVELKEKYRIEKQGFDRWSFRKMGKNSK